MSDFLIELRLYTFVLSLLLLGFGILLLAVRASGAIRFSLYSAAGVLCLAIFIALGPLQFAIGWLEPYNALFFLGAVLFGVFGALTVVLISRTRFIVAFLCMVLAAILFIGSVLLPGLLNPLYGWSLYAVPPALGGALLLREFVKNQHKELIIYIISWLAVVFFVGFPQLLSIIDSEEYSISYAYGSAQFSGIDPAIGRAAGIRGEIIVTSIYLFGSLALLAVPLLVGKIRWGRANGQNHHVDQAALTA